MGMLACYMSLSDELADELCTFENDEIIDKVEEIAEKNLCPVYEMDKLWNGLHFLLTGTSASTPIEGNHLSEAIVGVHVLDTKDFIGVIGSDELHPIIKELEGVNIDKLHESFKPSILKKKKIYPNIWSDENAEELFSELTSELKNLIAFYKESVEKQQDILVSIC